MPKYRKKPVVIEAVRLGWDTWNEMCEFVGVGKIEEGKPEGGWLDPSTGALHYGNMPPGHLSLDDAKIGMAIPTLEGLMVAMEGDWVIKGVKGEFYPCKPDIFKETYEEVEDGG